MPAFATVWIVEANFVTYPVCTVPSQLNFTEKGLRKMMEMSKSYKHALVKEEVLDTFKVLPYPASQQ